MVTSADDQTSVIRKGHYYQGVVGKLLDIDLYHEEKDKLYEENKFFDFKTKTVAYKKKIKADDGLHKDWFQKQGDFVENSDQPIEWEVNAYIDASYSGSAICSIKDWCKNNGGEELNQHDSVKYYDQNLLLLLNLYTSCSAEEEAHNAGGGKGGLWSNHFMARGISSGGFYGATMNNKVLNTYKQVGGNEFVKVQ